MVDGKVSRLRSLAHHRDLLRGHRRSPAGIHVDRIAVWICRKVKHGMRCLMTNRVDGLVPIAILRNLKTALGDSNGSVRRVVRRTGRGDRLRTVAGIIPSSETACGTRRVESFNTYEVCSSIQHTKHGVSQIRTRGVTRHVPQTVHLIRNLTEKRRLSSRRRNLLTGAAKAVADHPVLVEKKSCSRRRDQVACAIGAGGKKNETDD